MSEHSSKTSSKFTRNRVIFALYCRVTYIVEGLSVSNNSFSAVEDVETIYWRVNWITKYFRGAFKFDAGCLISNNLKPFQPSNKDLRKSVNATFMFDFASVFPQVLPPLQDYYHTEDTQNYGEGGVGHYNRWPLHCDSYIITSKIQLFFPPSHAAFSPQNTVFGPIYYGLGPFFGWIPIPWHENHGLCRYFINPIIRTQVT